MTLDYKNKKKKKKTHQKGQGNLLPHKQLFLPAIWAISTTSNQLISSSFTSELSCSNHLMIEAQLASNIEFSTMSFMAQEVAQSFYSERTCQHWKELDYWAYAMEVATFHRGATCHWSYIQEDNNFQLYPLPAARWNRLLITFTCVLPS